MMKRLFFVAITLCLMMPMTMNGQTYSSLWKQVSEAVDNDLPKTEQKLLRQIAEKAEAEGEYSLLLKAELQEARSLCSVSPDSLPSSVERLQQREQQARDSVLKAVYCCVLGYVYNNNSMLDEDNHQAIATGYYTRALAHPEQLAAVKSSAYDDIIDKRSDSRLFDDDLLSIIGYEAQRFDILSDYYVKSGNRRAALLTSLQVLKQQRPQEMERLNKSQYLYRLDSLINEYADLPECGEVAIERYDFMDLRTDATAAQKMLYLNEALQKWGSWQRMNVLRNRQRDLTALQFHLEGDATVLTPLTSHQLRLTNLRGLSGITVKLYRVKGDGDIDLNPSNRNDWPKLSKLLTAMPERTLTRTYVGKASYELFDDSLELAPLPKGVYMIEVESTPATRTARQLLFVSDVRLISQPLPGRQVRMVVVNATTGQPLPGAKIRVKSYIGYYDKTKEFTLTADAQGEAVYTRREKERSYDSFAYTDDDRFCPEVDLNGEYGYSKSDGNHKTISIYTDRRIYRPGQTVHAAAICYATTKGYIHTVEAGKEVTMQLIDANGQKVDEQKVATDAYGTCHADFTLPTRTLTGHFIVKADNGSEMIRVEEYKRPAFEVDIPAVTQGYEDGDTVVLRGTARSYAGVPVQGAKVRYKVVRRRAYWWMSYSYYWNQGLLGRETEDIELNEGETVTDGSGTFSVDVPIVVPKTRYPMFYNFVVTADVTDQAGETHHGERAIPMGNRPKAFSCTMPEKVLNDEPTTFTFHQQNVSGVDLDAQVRYRYDNTGRWQEARTNTLVQLPKMKSGRHSMQAICEGDTTETKFTVFALDDERPAEETDDWFYVSDHRFPVDGRPVTLQVGASDPKLHIVYSLYAADKVIESGAVERDGKLLNRKLTYKEEYGNGLLLTFAWVKTGEVHRHSTTIERPLPDMHLKLQWQTFRNRLTPGQQEEWTLTVMAPDGTPANAQLMATLYDKSLDQLAQHQWDLSPSTWLPTPSTWWQYGSWNGLSLYGYKHQGTLSVSGLQFSTFNHDLYPSRWLRYNRRYRRIGRSNGALVEDVMLMSKAAPMAEESKVFDAVEEMPMFKAESADEDAAEAEMTADGGASGSSESGPKVRENFDETAFFMPQLTTDSLGRVAMKFTLPESLTTWRFMGVAHTKDMMHGTLQDEAVARKEVMIQPNMPRFVRMGDRATISARVINMSEYDIKGTARLVLLDAETEKVVAQAAQPVNVTKDSTVAVTFPVQPRDKWPSLLIAKVTYSTSSTPQLHNSTAPHFSDGEQHYLAVLPSQEHVTVTVPFTQHEPGTKTIDLQQLIPGDASQAKLTVEYTNNPAWLMIQALPAIGHPHDDCALCQAASYYANSIGMNIIAQNPQAKEVFEQWSLESSTLNSQLQKNEELKDLLLDETPWIVDADREQEQRQRLADFFDQELMQQRLSSAIDKMKDLQQRDGSWSWWPGMRGSWYITVNISQMLVRLNTLTAQPLTSHLSPLTSQSSKMLDKAFKFMGNEAVDIVKEIKRMEKEYGIKPTFPNHTTLEWLYLCTLDGRKLPSKVQEANDYLIRLLKKEVKNQSIYDKAMTAIILNSKTYIKSTPSTARTWAATTTPTVPSTPGATTASPRRWPPSKPCNVLEGI